MTLDDLIESYFRMMSSDPSVEDLAKLAMTVPPHLQVSFLSWLRRRVIQLASAKRDDRLLN